MSRSTGPRISHPFLRLVTLVGRPTENGSGTVHNSAPCEDGLVLCSPRRARQAFTHPSSDCAARLPALAAQLPPHRKNRRFFLRRLSCVTHYTLQARSWASRSLWTPLKRLVGVSSLRLHTPPAAFGKDQNHTEPCFTDRIASSAFAFFAVLSPMPALRSRSMTSR